jgi:hypothetical protein
VRLFIGDIQYHTWVVEEFVDVLKNASRLIVEPRWPSRRKFTKGIHRVSDDTCAWCGLDPLNTKRDDCRCGMQLFSG